MDFPIDLPQEAAKKLQVAKDIVETIQELIEKFDAEVMRHPHDTSPIVAFVASRRLVSLQQTWRLKIRTPSSCLLEW